MQVYDRQQATKNNNATMGRVANATQALRDRGYVLYDVGEDTLALLVSSPTTATTLT